MVPGHEVVGRIEALGHGVEGWHIGQRVGVGFLAGEDRSCPSCRQGDVVNCENPVITGMTTDGGYAEQMLAEARGLVRVPEELDAAEAAPLLCAGLTTFNALRNANARAGDVVAVPWTGRPRSSRGAVRAQDGLPYSGDCARRRQGGTGGPVGRPSLYRFESEDTVAVLRSPRQAPRWCWGRRPPAPRMSALVPGLAARGRLVVVAVPGDLISLTATDLSRRACSGRRAHGNAFFDNEQTLAFANLQDIRPMIETFLLEQCSGRLRPHDACRCPFPRGAGHARVRRRRCGMTTMAEQHWTPA